MFQSIWQYIDLVGEYTNPAKIVFTAIMTAIGAFFLAGLLIILLRKFIFIKRRHVLLKVLAILYAIVIPILAGFFGFKLGLINGIHHDLKEHLGTYTKSLDAAFSEEMNGKLTEVMSVGNGTDLSKVSMKDLVDSVSVTIYDSYKQTLEYKAVAVKSDLTSKVSVLLLDLMSVKGISIALKKGITKLVEKSIGVDEEMTTEVMELRLSELLKSGLLTKIVGIQIDRLFNGLKNGIYLIFSIVLLIPAIEVFIAFYLHKKAAVQPASQN